METWNSIDRLMIISSDAHAGALAADYREYLPTKWHDEFDDWLGQITMPWFDNPGPIWNAEVTFPE